MKVPVFQLLTASLHQGPFYVQMEGAAMGSTVSAVMEVFEEQAIESTAQKPKTWKHYVDNTFTIQDCNYINCFLQHLNSYQPNIQFTLEIGKGNKIAFLDMPVMTEPDRCLNTSVYTENQLTLISTYQ